MTMTMGDASSAEDQKTLQDGATLARKRRIEMRNKQRSVSEDEAADGGSCADRKRPRFENDDSASSVLLVDPVTSKPKPHVTGIKKHSRYDPGVPMNREELKAWRKEARRVRNRESAAASRKKNRERIDELESEVDVLKSKYAAALQLIVDLEAGVVNDSFTPHSLRQDLAAMVPSATLRSPRATTPELEALKTVSPPMSPCYDEDGHHQHHANEVNQKHQHIMDMISRPIACV